MPKTAKHSQKQSTWLWQMLAVIALALAITMLWDGANHLPDSLVVPLTEWVTSFIKWLRSEDASFFGLFTVKDVTRSISFLLKFPLKWSEYFLYRGFRIFDLPPIPWITLTIGVGILGHWLGGLRLALLCVASCLFIAFFGLWKDSMKTLSIVLVAVPFAAALGLLIGIWVTRSKKAEMVFTPIFDLMQATPHMAYLAPVFALFGAGQVAAMLATVVFSMPSMARCTILGIQTVSKNIIESGQMSGCTKKQLLWKVALPSAHKILMLGLNQVVMQTLAMVVIASIVGASGLGQKLLYSLQQLRIGAAAEQGTAIVLLAITLDRLTQGFAVWQPDSTHKAKRSFIMQHKHLCAFIAVAIVVALLIRFIPDAKFLQLLPKKMTHTFGRELDDFVRVFVRDSYFIINPIRDFFTIYILLPMRDFYLWLPWVWVLAIVGFVGYRIGGVKIMALVSSLILLIVFSGFWQAAILTFYTVSIATLFCVILGMPLGIWAARNTKVAKVLMSMCDTLQTFPSFIYLIPAIMLLRVGDLAIVIAIIPYAMVPAIRFTYLGLRQLPDVLREAAIANGATSFQRLWKVEMPVAFPEIMLGINQTIMMALAMTAITALIGSQDLGQEIYRALAYVEYGRGILAGLWIASIGIIADRLIGSWAHERKRKLGIV